jgi:hypothetical protein
MHNADAAIRFAKQWGDTPSLERLRNSDKSGDVQKSEAENHLKNVALRFQYSPNQSTLALWAKDIIESGYTDEILGTVCKSIPFKFEKMPTLNQIMELLVHYKPKVSIPRDELSDLTDRTFEHLKAKFIKQASPEIFTQMVEYYVNHGCAAVQMFNVHYHEICMLNDWARSYFGDGKKIIEMAHKSNLAAESNDYEYFTRVLRQYAKENKL